MDVRQVAVAGTGMMGPGIAAIFALAGRQATIVSRTPEGASRGVAAVGSLIRILAANGLAGWSSLRSRQAGSLSIS